MQSTHCLEQIQRLVGLPVDAAPELKPAGVQNDEGFWDVSLGRPHGILRIHGSPPQQEGGRDR